MIMMVVTILTWLIWWTSSHGYESRHGVTLGDTGIILGRGDIDLVVAILTFMSLVIAHEYSFLLTL